MAWTAWPGREPSAGGSTQVVVGCENAGSEEDYLGAGSVYRLSDLFTLCTT